MESTMITLLNMSITAGFASLFVMALRLLYKRLPKRFTCVLWLAVIFRFLCPFSFPSPYSLLPFYSDPLRQEIIYETTPSVDSGVFFIDRPVNQVLEQTLGAADPRTSVNPIQILLFAMQIIWAMGLLAFFLYHFAGYIRLKRRVKTAVRIPDKDLGDNCGTNSRPEHGIYESDQIPAAFVMGVFRPVIYLPSGLAETERECVLSHERIHIRRLDHIVRLSGLLMVIVHWFNPLAHVSFRLICKDMEMSCDEAVVKEMGEDGKKLYSMALLSAAERGSGVSLPLAFGESNVKSRIRNVLRSKKSGFWITLCAVVITAAAVLGLMTAREKPDQPQAVSIIGGGDGPTSIFIAGKTEGGTPKTPAETPVEMPEAAWLSEQVLEKGTENSITLDYASKDQVIFHGACGLFSFRLEDGRWLPELILLPDESGAVDMEAINRVLDEAKSGSEKADSVRREDSFTERETLAGSAFLDYDAEKLDDGSVAVLGGMGMAFSDGAPAGRLVDVFYGWYHPDDMVMHQVYLFAGDGVMAESAAGELEERRYLFTTDGADYFVRTPQTALEFERRDGKEPESLHFPYDRMELIKSVDGDVKVLDPLMIMYSPENQRILLEEGRIYYSGAAAEDMVSFKSDSLIGIRTDGSDRRVAQTAYNVRRGLCYDNGYLYFEGWTNDNAFPKPIYRMKPDFSDMTKIGEFNGSLITVADGTFYMLSAEKPAIVLTREGNFEEVKYYDKCGYDAVNDTCIAAAVSDGMLRIRFLRGTEERDFRDYEIPLAEDRWWE